MTVTMQSAMTVTMLCQHLILHVLKQMKLSLQHCTYSIQAKTELLLLMPLRCIKLLRVLRRAEHHYTATPLQLLSLVESFYTRTSSMIPHLLCTLLLMGWLMELAITILQSPETSLNILPTTIW